ncbi:MAG: hypothetical protein H7Z74_13025 [Anaerolineae bacterium]|nr:hypothetical protein [Gemmatimonadaceae bacterium]
MPSTVTTAMRGTVDVLAGTLTFEPLPDPSSSLSVRRNISAAIYGNQGSTVRIYNSAVTVTEPSSPGKKTYSANVGVRNLLAFPIGDEQAGVPTDTMGIYAFVNSGPTVISTSSACTPACVVTVLNNHGTLAFNALAQKYWHWQERLGAAGSPTDTTLLRKSWVFEADTKVTAFSFDVLISAAWSAPNETRWKIDYQGDSLPLFNAEPRWQRITAGTLGTVVLNTPSAGILTITVPASARLNYYRNDSLRNTTNAYIESRFRTNTATTGPEMSFGIDDDVKFIAVGLSGTQVGFISGSFAFIGTPVTASTTTFHTYQIRKFAADSAQLWMDGARIASRTNSAFSASIVGISYGFYFGIAGVGISPLSVSGSSSSWDYVIYEIGVVQP